MKLTQSEWHIMNALWKHHPATVREVMERLPTKKKWAYTTVKTMLTRLTAKEAVSERKIGNTCIYKPLVSLKKARQSAVWDLLNQAFDGAVEPLLHFLVAEKKLSTKQRRELKALLRQEEKKRPGRR